MVFTSLRATRPPPVSCAQPQSLRAGHPPAKLLSSQRSRVDDGAVDARQDETEEAGPLHRFAARLRANVVERRGSPFGLDVRVSSDGASSTRAHRSASHVSSSGPSRTRRLSGFPAPVRSATSSSSSSSTKPCASSAAPTRSVRPEDQRLVSPRHIRKPPRHCAGRWPAKSGSPLRPPQLPRSGDTGSLARGWWM
jgi:hypothetical protein